MTELKVLLCDDDEALQGLCARRLEKMGIKPDSTDNGRKAIQLVKENNYDLIVTDIYMPEATGLEVLQFAKQLDPETQVVIMTSSSTMENAIDALNHGAFGYLTKPFDHLIVFDNMVSRAIEYRQMLVGEKQKAQAQKRRGDMLEDEVTQRVQQLQKKQKGLLDLLGSLPDGILVVDEEGKVVLSSPVGERWLALDSKSGDQPIHAFMSQVHSEMAEVLSSAELDGHEITLMAADFPDDGDKKRKAVIIREAEESGLGAGDMVTETVTDIKKGLAALYEQGVGTDVVLNIANQFAMLEQLAGWAGGTGELTRADLDSLQPAAAPAEPVPATAEVEEPPAEQETAQRQSRLICGGGVPVC